MTSFNNISAEMPTLTLSKNIFYVLPPKLQIKFSWSTFSKEIGRQLEAFLSLLGFSVICNVLVSYKGTLIVWSLVLISRSLEPFQMSNKIPL